MEWENAWKINEYTTHIMLKNIFISATKCIPIEQIP